MDLVEIRKLTKTFDHTVALESIDASIERGTIVGLAGPDGAGKTTLIRLIAGLLLPTEGSIAIDGHDTVKEAEAVHEMIGYMPQRFGLYEDLTVQQNLTLYADLKGVKGEERGRAFERLLDLTGLKPFTKRLAGNLSGGMKQRLGLACSLISKPTLLLLDEPTVGVDPLSRRELWKMIQELSAEGITIVWSTTYLDEVERCNSAILLAEGKMLYRGVPQALTARVQGRTFLIKDLAERTRPVLREMLNREDVLDATIQGNAVRIVMKPNAQPPAGASPTPPRFEDAFMDILYHDWPETSDLERAKAPGFDDRNSPHISNMGRVTIVESRELSRSSKSKFLANRGIGGATKGESKLAQRMPKIEPKREYAIEAQHLTKRFDSFVAADHVDFQVKAGEVFGLLGPNGAGKTTIFKMLCGLIKPTEGKSDINGLDFQTAPVEARSHIGYMAQRFSLYGGMSVKQNLDFFSGVYQLSERRERIEQMIEIFELQQFLNQNASLLPLGVKQRLALSCATMHRPEVIFLDEPTSGVDPVMRREFWTHINGLVEKGTTIMITTHFLDEAEYCNRIALIYQGKIITIGTPDELKEKAKANTLEDAFITLIEQYGAPP